MDNVKMDCSYLALSPSHDSKCFTLHQVNFKCKSHCFFSDCNDSKVWEFLHYTYDLHANAGGSSLSISD